MPDQDDVLYSESGAVLTRRPDNPHDDYALRVGPMYAEFSNVQWQDKVLLLLSGDGGYVSVRHGTGVNDISEGVYDALLALD